MHFAHAIVCPPAPSYAAGLTTAHLGAPNVALALEQHVHYCAALERCGLRLIRLPADSDYPDSTFVEDTAILTAHGALLTRPGAPSRVGEVASIRAALAPFYAPLPTIEAPGTLDGGDICQADTHFFIGVSERTNTEGARQLAAWLAQHGYTASCIDIRQRSGLLHLKSGLAYLGDNRLVIVDALADEVALQGYDLLRAPAGEAYAANCVRVNEYVLVAAGYPGFEARLRDLGYTPIPLPMSEFQKMDGGLSCLSLRW